MSWYIRLNENKEIIKAFSDCFTKPEKTDILYKETDERHFHLDIIENINEISKYKYKYINGDIIENDLTLTSAEQMQVEFIQKKNKIREKLPELLLNNDTLLKIKEEIDKL